MVLNKGEFRLKMTVKQRFAALAGLICCGGIAVCIVISRLDANQTAPVITFESEERQVAVGITEQELLSDVTAWDEQDGDVTHTLLVEGISNISKEKKATATYVAFDESGNVSKAQRSLFYADYQSPRFSLSRALIFRQGASFNVMRYIGAQDAIDGELDDKVKGTLVGGETGLSELGIHDVEFRVTNSMGETVYLTVPVEVYAAGTYQATLELTDYLVFLKKNAAFSPYNYLATLQSAGETVSMRTIPDNVALEIDSNVNTAVPGTYCVEYTATMHGNKGYSRLIVVVEE